MNAEHLYNLPLTLTLHRKPNQKYLDHMNLKPYFSSRFILIEKKKKMLLLLAKPASTATLFIATKLNDTHSLPASKQVNRQQTRRHSLDSENTDADGLFGLVMMIAFGLSVSTISDSWSTQA